MSNNHVFDPYYTWLGIPPEDQPPNYYQLLGLKLFEAHHEVIANAADQRMRHLRTFQTGKHSDASQKLLNEVSAARLCLLDAMKKAAYDQQLEAAMAPVAQFVEEPMVSPAYTYQPTVMETFAPATATPSISVAASHRNRRSPKRRSNNISANIIALVMWGGMAAIILATVGGVIRTLSDQSAHNNSQTVKQAASTLNKTKAKSPPPHEPASRRQQNPSKTHDAPTQFQSDSSTAGDHQEQQRAAAPQLLSPVENAVLDNGRADNADWVRWDFKWAPVKGADAYELCVIAPNASVPLTFTNVPQTTFHFQTRQAFVDNNRPGFLWKVRAVRSGEPLSWSETRTFDVEPIDTDPVDPSLMAATPVKQRPNAAEEAQEVTPAADDRPVLLEPKVGAVMDNGRSDAKGKIEWEFSWKPVDGADSYQLFVIRSGARIPVANVRTKETHYRHEKQGSYVAAHNVKGWTWKVRAFRDGAALPWSEIRTFEVEPPDMDALQKFTEDENGNTAIPAASEYESLRRRAAGAGQLNPIQRKQLIKDVAEFIENQKTSAHHLSLAMQTARTLESAEDRALASEAYSKFADLLAATNDAKAAAYVEKMRGAARRNQLIGHPLELQGQTLDGMQFHWGAYRGKVVLIDFWATWCGPCIRELPNIMTNYEKYHDRGFEVVGVSLDSDAEKLRTFLAEKKIPWENLFSHDPTAARWDHPLVVKYGVLSIPASILVDRKGNVVSLNARGERLETLLKQLLDDGK